MFGISFVIPVKNSDKYLYECLSSIANQDIEKECFEIIVVDNESSDNSVLIAKEFTENIYVSRASNASGVRNDGACHAKFEIIAFIDSDCVIPGDWASKVLSSLSEDPQIGVVGGNYLANPDGTWVEKAWSPIVNRFSGFVRSLPGGNMAFRREVWNLVGGFNTSLRSAEDDEICRRVREKGFLVCAKAELGVIHLGNATRLTEFYRKVSAHASTQLKAHGFLRDRMVILTFCYIFAVVVVGASLLSGAFIGVLLGGALYLMVIAAFMTRRIRLSGFFYFVPWFFEWILLANVFFVARGLGMIRELILNGKEWVRVKSPV